MSYTKTGYIKSIYGIIADAIKEDIKILLKSDYFAYQFKADCTSKIRCTQGMEKRETENTDELLYLSVVALHVFSFAVNCIIL